MAETTKLDRLRAVIARSARKLGGVNTCGTLAMALGTAGTSRLCHAVL